MLSTRLVHHIEAHADTLASMVVNRFRDNEDLSGYHSLSEVSLYDRVRELCANLGEWLSEKSEDHLRERYEALGRQRFKEGVPLHQVVLALQVTKARILAYARSGGFGETALELYGREELELRIAHFFDRAVYYLVREYERSLRTRM
jgi:hypothetical protein